MVGNFSQFPYCLGRHIRTRDGRCLQANLLNSKVERLDVLFYPWVGLIPLAALAIDGGPRLRG